MLGEHYNSEENPIDPWIVGAFNLYIRCRKLKDIVLPKEGGLFDQEELTLVMLEIVHDVVMKHEQELQENDIRKMEGKMRAQGAMSDRAPRTRF
jgi:hypothetical protein